MTESSIINRDDYEDFLLVCFFGSNGDYLSRCIARAYRDFNRTMHGFGKHASKQDVDIRARTYLHKCFTDLKTTELTTHTEFDSWHRQASDRLCGLYREFGAYDFFVGQAQKWLNMTFKYIYTMGEHRISGFWEKYPLSHVPLDNILIEQLARYGFPLRSGGWSRINDYDTYLSYQRWIREHFRRPPLDVEFLLWMGKSPD